MASKLLFVLVASMALTATSPAFAQATDAESIDNAEGDIDKQVALNRATILSNLYPNYASAPPGYYTGSVPSPREIGVTLRYAFGSR